MRTQLQKRARAQIYRCNYCKIKYHPLNEMAIGNDGLVCPACHEAEVKHRNFLWIIAATITAMKQELDERSKKQEASL